MFSYGVLNKYARAAIVSFPSEDKRESDRWTLMVMLNVTTRDNQRKIIILQKSRAIRIIQSAAA